MPNLLINFYEIFNYKKNSYEKKFIIFTFLTKNYTKK